MAICPSNASGRRCARAAVVGGAAARAALALLAALVACRAVDAPPLAADEAPPPSSSTAGVDLLTDLADDGSLSAGLHAGDAQLRALAACELGRLTGGAPGDTLLKRLAVEDDATVLAEICFALGQRRVPDAAPRLQPFLRHSEPVVRAAAATAIGRLAVDGETAALSALLADGAAEVRGAAALALLRLDGRRYDHPRTAPEDVLARRDEQLAAVLRLDPDAEVRWRAACALAGLRSRPSFHETLLSALDDPEALVRLFALRGLTALAREGGAPLPDLAGPLRDDDDRVVTEAVAALGAGGDLPALVAALADSRPAHARRVAAEALATRLAADDVESEPHEAALSALERAAREDASGSVRREAQAALVRGRRDEAAARDAWQALARSASALDRLRAAELCAVTGWSDEAGLAALLDDEVPAVAAAALGAPMADRAQRSARLVAALQRRDAALRTAAAQAAQAEMRDGTIAPELGRALAAALHDSVGPDMKEARQALRAAFGLPPETDPPAPAPPGRLLDRVRERDAAARADPTPRVRLATSRGDIVLQLDRVAAPRHVESLLALAEEGFHDGASFHRVVPNFVVQGLDPRGDGWGTGGRRLPDEISPRPYLTGTLGMPNAGEPHTGGCQIFITLVPTPHLDGGYTVFGGVVEGLAVVQNLEPGDTVHSVRRID